MRRCSMYVVAVLALSAGMLASPALAGPPSRALAWDDYQSRLRGLWLAQCVANWTGLQTEGDRRDAPFYTDVDWAPPIGTGPVDFVLDLDPWPADDDTDIEYVYVHLMDEAFADSGSIALSPERLSQGWIDHVNRFIWVSNERARGLMGRGMRTPTTALSGANVHRLKIDAQLTTEIFGAVYPGMVDEALAAAEPAILATATGHAAHASQLYVAIYALAPLVPEALSPADQMVWLLTEARAWIPAESKAGDVADTVLADYLANPDPTDWERTRDLVYHRFQLSASANGYVYRGWTESAVNLAGGLIALLYGQGDLPDTIRIGSLTGWDSDNGTATIAGALGLMLGDDAVEAAFATHPDYPATGLSDRYDIDRTRDNMPDYLPGDPEAQDTLTLLAERMMPLVASAVVASGGAAATDAWLVLPPALSPEAPGARRSDRVATTRLARRSANLAQTLAGFVPVGSDNVAASPTTGGVANVIGNPAFLRTALDVDFLDGEHFESNRRYYSSQGSGQSEGDELVLSVTYAQDVPCRVVRFTEGDHFTLANNGVEGGWFTSLQLELLIGGSWVTPPDGVTQAEPLDPLVPFQIIDLELSSTVMVRGVRVRGLVGPGGFATASDLDAFDALAPPPTERPTYDRDADGRLDIDDLHRAHAEPFDFDGDGDTDRDDLDLIEFAHRVGTEPGLNTPTPNP
ncbi:MAG: ADP-ribosylglycohydrolase family protein [Planctomycetota bacterium]